MRRTTARSTCARVASSVRSGIGPGSLRNVGSTVRPDEGDFMLGDAIDAGLADSVNDNDAKFPPEFRLSKSNRKKKD